MKNLSTLLAALFIILLQTTSSAQVMITESFKLVDGECRSEYCKKQMESFFDAKGIKNLEWDTETRYFTVTYDMLKISADDIKKRWATYIQSGNGLVSKGVKN
jgi:hypothetical protein